MVSKCTSSLTNQEDITVVMAAAEHVIAGIATTAVQTMTDEWLLVSQMLKVMMLLANFISPVYLDLEV